MDEIRRFFEDFQDHGAPRLDVYEQAVYLYIARHTFIKDISQAVIGFKSARKKLAFGTGKVGTPPSEHVVYQKLRGLESKGFIKILASERSGTKIELLTPFLGYNEKLQNNVSNYVSIDDADFFDVPHNRKLILKRDRNTCFYCMTILDDKNYVIEHVVSRPTGDNSFRNLVASCRRCNNRKDASPADGYLRQIYRDGILSQDELANRLQQLEQLQLGNLKPDWPESD